MFHSPTDAAPRFLQQLTPFTHKSERSYCVTRRELLAIVEFVKQHQHYLQGARFCIQTDHAPCALSLTPRIHKDSWGVGMNSQKLLTLRSGIEQDYDTRMLTHCREDRVTIAVDGVRSGGGSNKWLVLLFKLKFNLLGVASLW